MADPPITSTTLIGAAVAACVGLIPVAAAKLLGRKKDDADVAESIGAGAGAVTTAALALLAQMEHDRDACRAELERMEAKIARVDARLDVIHGDNTGRPPPPT